VGRALHIGLVWLVLSLTVAPLMLATAAGELATLGAAAVTLVREFGPAVGLSLAGVGFVVTYPLALAVHEGGHVLGGRLAGWRARSVRVGPVTLTRRQGRWALGWRCRAGWLTGWVETGPGPADRWRPALFVGAGPAASLALGAVAGAVAAAGLPSGLRCWAALFAVHSVCLGVWSVVPLKERGHATDGLRLWRLAVRGGEAWRRA
jgi:hypothetical protein